MESANALRSRASRSAHDCGEIPLYGRFNHRRWALMLGISEKTFKEWLREYDIPKRRIGNDLFVDAAELWAAIPVS